MIDTFWKQTASPAEIEALTHMIEAFERVRLLKMEFDAAREVLSRFKIEVTHQMADDASLLMEEMTVAHNGAVYLLTLDKRSSARPVPLIKKIGSVINLD